MPAAPSVDTSLPCSVLSGVFALAVASTATAQEPGVVQQSQESPHEPIQLRLTGAESASCIKGKRVATQVNQLLGWPGLRLDASAGAVDVTLKRSTKQLAATATWLGPRSELLGQRALVVGDNECERLMQALVFALAVERGFDPNSVGQGAATKPEPAAPPAPSARKPRRTVTGPPRSLPQHEERRWSVAAGFTTRVGVVPELVGGSLVGVGVEGGWYALQLRSLVVLPQAHAVGARSGFRYWEAATSLRACGGVPMLRLCPAIEAFYARISGFGSAVIPSSDAGIGWRVGAVAVFSLPVGNRWRAGLEPALWLPTERQEVTLGNAIVWSARVGYALSLEIRHELF